MSVLNNPLLLSIMFNNREAVKKILANQIQYNTIFTNETLMGGVNF
jgi:hypothetical protein